MKYLELRAGEAMPHADQIAALRIKIFADWPYLYDGELNYERGYLRNYFSAKNSFIILAINGSEVVGASTAIWLPEAETAFQNPFVAAKINPESVCYYGESVLLPEFRGQGVGHKFMHAREKFARSLS